MTLLNSTGMESGTSNEQQLMHVVLDMVDFCHLSSGRHPECHAAIMMRFEQIQRFAKDRFGWVLRFPVGLLHELHHGESQQLNVLMNKYGLGDDIWIQDKGDRVMD
jgi:hypothetical protein